MDYGSRLLYPCFIKYEEKKKHKELLRKKLLLSSLMISIDFVNYLNSRRIEFLNFRDIVGSIKKIEKYELEKLQKALLFT